MIFYNKLAKLGKGKYVDCYCLDPESQQFDVYISNGKVSQKTLDVINKNYILSKVKNIYVYDQAVSIDSQYIFARIDNLFSIVQVQNES